ncbi:esterase [Spirochaetia bacterium]|nr:esterase [Spirochaetia bacterium]
MRTIRSFIEESIEAGACPGAVWIVGDREKILEQGTAGVLGEGLGPVQSDSIYDFASITKIFTTLTLMRELEDGLLRLSDTIGYFMPEWQRRNYNKADIPLLEIVTHSSPIDTLLDIYYVARTKQDLLDGILRSPLRKDNASMVQYTCDAYILLGEIIAHIEGTTLDEAVRRRVIEPLGMTDTGYLPPAQLLDRIAPTEFSEWRGGIMTRGQVHDENAVIMGGVSGNAGIFGPASSLAKIAAMMLNAPAAANGHTHSSTSFLHPATIAMMTKCCTEGRNKDSQRRGIGWLMNGPGAPAGDLMTENSYGHTGYTGTSIWIDPVYGLYGVLLSNRVHPTRANTKFFRVRSVFHNLIVLNYSQGGS